MADKCWKGRPHKYVKVDTTETHNIKQCANCKGKKWEVRRNGVILINTREPLRV